jgi:hypothetical protein
MEGGAEINCFSAGYSFETQFHTLRAMAILSLTTFLKIFFPKKFAFPSHLFFYKVARNYYNNLNLMHII